MSNSFFNEKILCVIRYLKKKKNNNKHEYIYMNVHARIWKKIFRDWNDKKQKKN